MSLHLSTYLCVHSSIRRYAAGVFLAWFRLDMEDLEISELEETELHLPPVEHGDEEHGKAATPKPFYSVAHPHYDHHDPARAHVEPYHRSRVPDSLDGSSAPTPRSYRSRNRQNAGNFMVKDTIATGQITPGGRFGSLDGSAAASPRWSHSPRRSHDEHHHIDAGDLGDRIDALDLPKKCNGCDETLTRKAAFCPRCGNRVEKQQSKKETDVSPPRPDKTKVLSDLDPDVPPHQPAHHPQPQPVTVTEPAKAKAAKATPVTKALSVSATSHSAPAALFENLDAKGPMEQRQQLVWGDASRDAMLSLKPINEDKSGMT